MGGWFGDRGAMRVETGSGTMIVGDGAGTSEGIYVERASDGSELTTNFALFFDLGFSILDLDTVLDDDFVFEDV